MQPESSSFVGDRMSDVMGQSERLRQRRQQVQAEVTALEGQADELQEQLRLLRNRIRAHRNELEFIQRSEDDNSCEWKQLCEARMPSSATRAATVGAFHRVGMPLLPAQQLPLWTPTTDVVDLKDISRNVVNLSALSDECGRKQVQASGSAAAEGFGSPLQSIVNLISNDMKRPVESQNITGDEEPMPATKRAKSSQKIGLEELRNHTANIGQHWDRDSKVLRCPVCSSEVKAATARKACQHVVDHFGDKTLFPYKCPVDGCGHAAVRPTPIQVHVKNAHKLDWTDGMEDSSVSGAEHRSQPSTPSFVASLEREPWYHGKAAKRYASALLRNHGDFLVRLGQSRADNQFKPVLSVKWNERDYHFLIRESDGLFSVEGRYFDSITGLVAFYAQRKCSLTRKSGAKLLRAVDKKGAAPPSGRNSAGKQKVASSAEPSQSWASSAAENLTELMPLLLKLALICVVIVVLHFCRVL